MDRLFFGKKYLQVTKMTWTWATNTNDSVKATRKIKWLIKQNSHKKTQTWWDETVAITQKMRQAVKTWAWVTKAFTSTDLTRTGKIQPECYIHMAFSALPRKLEARKAIGLWRRPTGVRCARTGRPAEVLGAGQRSTNEPRLDSESAA